MLYEIDYSGLHIHMLYDRKGIQLENADPYRLDGYADIRNFLKMVLLISVNADSKSKAKRAIIDEINKGNIEKPESIKSIDDVIDDFVKKHTEIIEYFFSGVGLELQFLDSQLAEKVMVSFASKGHAILPIHDSFIVEAELEEHLNWCMADAYFEMYRMKCPVSVNDKMEMHGDFYQLVERAQGIIKTDSNISIDEKKYKKLLAETMIEFENKRKDYSWYWDMHDKKI